MRCGEGSYVSTAAGDLIGATKASASPSLRLIGLSNACVTPALTLPSFGCAADFSRYCA
jgi:hypothetical protein